MIVIESWLHPQILDASVELPGWTLDCQIGNKNTVNGRGGGLHAYVLQDWYQNSQITGKHCSLNGHVHSALLPTSETVAIVTTPQETPPTIRIIKIWPDDALLEHV